ncbi:MAG: GatB/YqeY domain-containing protein [Thermotogota bacterium]|nr:GatB/YqeY domain-containing protein [Thermotogota bacterium]
MKLYEELQNELKKSLKSRDSLRANTIRSVIAAVKNYLTSSEEAKEEGATDEIVQKLIMKEVKNRKESIEQYEKADRKELAEKEQKEMEILKEFMPEMLSEDEIRKLAIETIDEIDAKDPSDLGNVMRNIMPKVKGRADGKVVNKIVRELLESR